MIGIELILSDLQEQLHKTEDQSVRVTLQNIIADILSSKYNVRTW